MQWKYLQICQWEPEEGTVWDKEEPLPERYPSVELKPEWKNLGYSVLNTSFHLSSWIFFLNFMEMFVWQNFFNVFSLGGEQDIGVIIQEKPNLREFLFIKRKKRNSAQVKHTSSLSGQQWVPAKSDSSTKGCQASLWWGWGCPMLDTTSSKAPPQGTARATTEDDNTSGKRI